MSNDNKNNYEKVLIELSVNFTLMNSAEYCHRVYYVKGHAVQYIGVKVENDKVIIGNGRWIGKQGVNFKIVDSKIFLRSNEGTSPIFWERIKQVYLTYNEYLKECKIIREKSKKINDSVIKIQSTWRSFNHRRTLKL